jgi:hypothetical protein
VHGVHDRPPLALGERSTETRSIMTMSPFPATPGRFAAALSALVPDSRADRVIWGTIAATFVASLFALWLSGFTVQLNMLLLQMLALAAACGTVAWLLRRNERLARVRAVSVAISQCLLMLVATKPLHYVLMATNRPLVDQELAAIDQWLGFDWPAYVAFFASHPWLDRTVRQIYAGNVAHSALMLVVVGYASGIGRLKEMVGIATAASLATILICWLVPALGAHSHYQHPGAAGVSYIADVMAVRAGALRTITYDEVTGIATFPSYHTVMALMFVWGALGRWPVAAVVIAVEIGMLLGIPLEGSHHVVDMLGGLALFVVTLWLWRTWVGPPRAVR